MYGEVRKMREEKMASEKKITTIFNQLKTDFSKDWLLSLELYELALQYHFSVHSEILLYLLKLKENTAHKNLIENGLNLLKANQPKV